jgi:hypothetical protein
MRYWAFPSNDQAEFCTKAKSLIDHLDLLCRKLQLKGLLHDSHQTSLRGRADTSHIPQQNIYSCSLMAENERGRRGSYVAACSVHRCLSLKKEMERRKKGLRFKHQGFVGAPGGAKRGQSG